MSAPIFRAVDLTPGYGLPKPTVERLQILDWIFEQAGGEPMTPVECHSLTEQGFSFEKLESHLQAFEHEGLVGAERSAVSTAVYLLQPGLDSINFVHHKRADVPARRRALRESLLRWLYDQNAHGTEWAYIDQFMQSTYGFYYGEPFPERDVAQATNWLKENGYLRGQGSSWGGVARPGITAKGETVVESGVSVNDSAALASVPPPAAMTITNNISGGTNNIANASPHAQQSMSITTDARQQMVQVADALDGLLDRLGLDAENFRVAQEASRDLRDESAAPAPDHGRLRALLEKVKEVAVSGTGTALGSAIVALAEQAIAAIG